ncbi:MAG TPA: hypothetical protein VIR81_06110 [Myxococcales bacterium]|nr:hypothetical protein [Myxococcales bacterium]
MATKIRLGAKDAALVFRADGTLEAVMPLLHEDEELPLNVVAAQALEWAHEDEFLMATIAEAVEGRSTDGAGRIVRPRRDRRRFNRLN